MIDFNKTELEDLDYLMSKVINGEDFYALEISKAKYLLGRIKDVSVGVNETEDKS